MGIDVRAVLDEQPGNLRLVLRCGKHQGCVPLELVRAVDIGSAVDQQLHRVDIARTRGQHQRSFSGAIRGVWIRSRFQQDFHHCDIANSGSLNQGSHPIAVRDLHAGTGGNQESSDFRIAVMSRPDQRRRPINIRSVWIGVLLQQCSDGDCIPALHCINESNVIEGSGNEDGNSEQDRDYEECEYVSGLHSISWLLVSRNGHKKAQESQKAFRFLVFFVPFCGHSPLSEFESSAALAVLVYRDAGHVDDR